MIEVAPVNTMLHLYKTELEAEMTAILSFWSRFMPDEKLGGFYASLDNLNQPDGTALKGVVLNSRILWAFSAAATRTGNPAYTRIAHRAYEYIREYFIDYHYGGVFWAVQSQGKVVEDRKQVYGIAFCIYGLSEYFRLTKLDEALTLARKMAEQLETHSLDQAQGGYEEAFARDWQPVTDLRLSEKDSNEKKTANTHLHLVEAYTNLFDVYPDPSIAWKVQNLLDIFFHRFIDPVSNHLLLFMDENWNTRSSLVSYGHDIEAAWLLHDCAQKIHDRERTEKAAACAIGLANAAAEGLDTDGGLWYEYDPEKGGLIKEKHSWPQAEGMLGFFHAWQLTGKDLFLERSLGCWRFVQHHLKDQQHGEWFWGVKEGYEIMKKEKAGFWKCPYHNTRACLELTRRISAIQ